HPSDTYVFTMKMEILLEPASNKLLVGTDDDDDNDEDFLVDEENEIVEPDVDVYLFVTNDDKINDYKRRRLAELSIEIEGVINASGQWKPTGPNRGIEAGPNGSSGPTTRSKKIKNTCTNDDSQASSILNAHDKGISALGSCMWKKTNTQKFGEKIFDQVKVNPDIPVKAVQDHLQRDLEVQISMSKAFRAKAKAKREIRRDHILRDLLGLDGAFMKGPFPGQVLSDVELDSNNGIYPLSYALVKAESRPRKKRKRSKHEDEPFVKDGKLSRKGRTITCQSRKNIGHNKATCKGQCQKATTGGNNAEASGSASRQAQQTEPAVGQDGSGAGVIIGLSAAVG
ncbi:hypothetical protein Tco_0273677, partial [Tanacetum coccineum]